MSLGTVRQFEVNVATWQSCFKALPRSKAFAHDQAVTEAEAVRLVDRIRPAYISDHPFIRKDIASTANGIR